MRYGATKALPAINERLIKLRLEICEVFGSIGIFGFDCFMKRSLSTITDSNLDFCQQERLYSYSRLFQKDKSIDEMKTIYDILCELNNPAKTGDIQRAVLSQRSFSIGIGPRTVSQPRKQQHAPYSCGGRQVVEPPAAVILRYHALFSSRRPPMRSSRSNSKTSVAAKKFSFRHPRYDLSATLRLSSEQPFSFPWRTYPITRPASSPRRSR